MLYSLDQLAVIAVGQACRHLHCDLVTQGRTLTKKFDDYHADMVPSSLAGEQTWILICAPGSVPDRELADAFGVKEVTILSMRWRLKQTGWTCRANYGVCADCGKPFTRQGSRSGTRRYHPESIPLPSSR